jgi:hypothetical protein
MTLTVSPQTEGRWLWRRTFVFTVVGGLWLLGERVVERLPPDRLPHALDGLMHLTGLTLVLYLVAPTAQELVTLIAQLRFGGAPR